MIVGPPGLLFLYYTLKMAASNSITLSKGNGKTISVKAVMKDCLQQDYPVLYVKHFKSEYNFYLVHDKA